MSDKLDEFFKLNPPSMWHQLGRFAVSNIAGFAMQKLVENAYDQFLMNRQSKLGPTKPKG